MKSFFQKMSESLKYGAALVAGGLYIWAIIILVNNDNWVGISALTTMLLAIAAFWAIWQNRSLQIRERKEKLLNEIIEWAKDVGKCAFETDPNEEIAKDTLQGKLPPEKSHDFILKHRGAFENGYRNIRWLNEYIKEIAEDFEGDLKSVGELIAELEKHEKLLHAAGMKFLYDEEIGKYVPGLPEKAKKIAKHNKKLDDITKNVMKEAADTKIKVSK